MMKIRSYMNYERKRSKNKVVQCAFQQIQKKKKKGKEELK